MPICMLQLTCQKSMKGEIHLIPMNYTGEVIIIFGIPEGVRISEISGKRLYIIPASGVLKANAEPNTGWISGQDLLEFYYVDSLGNKVAKLPYVPWNSNDTFDKARTVGIPAVEYYTIGDESLDVTYMKYKVDTLVNIHRKYMRVLEKDKQRIEDALAQ